MGPLEGLRVLERAGGVAGPYAGRLLALLGATVVKWEPASGDPTRRQASDERPAEDPSDLFVALNTGKALVSDVGSPTQAAAWADVVLFGGSRTGLESGPFASAWAQRGGSLWITTSPWGFETGSEGEVPDELLVQARSGLLSLTGDPDGVPLRFPGFVAQAFAGAYAAAAALAGLRARATRHIDVPWVLAMASGIEASFARALQTGRSEPLAGAHPRDLYPSGALPCADGFVSPGTIRPLDWVAQCRAYGRAELASDERFRSRARRAQQREALWNEIEPWYRQHTRHEIFARALDVGWALGMVLLPRDALADPHLNARAFYASVALPDGEHARVPQRPWLAPGLPAARPRLAARGEDDAWFAEQLRAPRLARPGRMPLARVRVLELTQAWAGPFVGRFLGALGADVVKLEGARRPDGWRAIVSFKQAAPHVPGHAPEELSIEINANFNTINRNKRQGSLDLAGAEGRALFLDLVRVADVLVVNMTARVLPGLGLEDAVLRAANSRLIIVHMPALGAQGPYRDAVGYGSIIEAMGGFAALFGAPEEGARISQTFFPDPVAGIHGAVAVLSMLERREQSGEGGVVDLSQQETLWLLLAESLVAASRRRDLARSGNQVPGCERSGVVRALDGRFVAHVSPASADGVLARAGAWDAEECAMRLRGCGARAEVVRSIAEAAALASFAHALEDVVHPVTERVRYLAVPLHVDGAPLRTRRPAPTFDQHTEEILREWLGLDRAGFERARAAGAVGGAPDPAALRAVHLERARAAPRPDPA